MVRRNLGIGQDDGIVGLAADGHRALFQGKGLACVFNNQLRIERLFCTHTRSFPAKDVESISETTVYHLPRTRAKSLSAFSWVVLTPSLQVLRSEMLTWRVRHSPGLEIMGCHDHKMRAGFPRYPAPINLVWQTPVLATIRCETCSNLRFQTGPGSISHQKLARLSMMSVSGQSAGGCPVAPAPENDCRRPRATGSGPPTSSAPGHDKLPRRIALAADCSTAS